MNLFFLFITAIWMLFVVYWLISAVGVKKNIGRQVWRSVSLRIIIFVVLVALLQISQVRTLLNIYPDNRVLNAVGVLLCAAGMAFAFWARIYLGRNWGMPMSLKDGAELITGGPYQYVRHPIYSGVLLALLGSAMVGGLIWMVLFVAMGGYFLYSARIEEQLMMQQFPGQYGQYKQKTKALIPGIY